MLQLFDTLRMEAEERQEALRPDFLLLETRTRALLAEIDACVSRLDAQHERVIRLRFYDQLSAKQIAGRMAVANPRAVYTLVDGALRRLRQLVGDSRAIRTGQRARTARGAKEANP